MFLIRKTLLIKGVAPFMGCSQETGKRSPWNNSGRDPVVARTKRDREGMRGSRNTGHRRVSSPGGQQRIAELLLCWFRKIPTELSLTLLPTSSLQQLWQALTKRRKQLLQTLQSEIRLKWLSQCFPTTTGLCKLSSLFLTQANHGVQRGCKQAEIGVRTCLLPVVVAVGFSRCQSCHQSRI